ncbi:MAG: hypothetical protein M1818_001978 [Claussenomyces sp. TS43310]|nr:MAG: hypothetical protein M1818_001978 [Claussenomyces sp. TS43310]
MSDVQKPVEAQPVEPVVPVEVVPAAEVVPETKAEETVVPATTEAAPATESAPVAEESTPATEAAVAAAPETTTPAKEFSGEGVLGYKAPGGFLKKLAGFQKKYFWFGDEAVELRHLASSYIRGEKVEVANHNIAWSNQTGKGLLYFSKHASEKASPAGIINLSDVTDVTEDGPTEFFFHAHAQKHAFQAGSITERDSWVSALKTKAIEAKEISERITSSEGYKEDFAALSKPVGAKPSTAAAGAATPVAPKTQDKKEEKAEAKEDKAEAKEEKKEEKAVAKEEKKEEKLEVKDAAKSRKSRSASRKRQSIFGAFSLGGSKKEGKTEASETAAVEPAVESAPVEPVAEPAPLDGPAVAAAVVAAPVVGETTATEAAPVETSKPVPVKRNSVFGNLSHKFGSKKTVSDEAPIVPAKDDAPVEVAPVSAEAPVIPEPEATEPLATSIASPATAPAETTTVTNGTSTPEELKESKPTTKSEKRKSSLPFGFGGKKEKATSDSETEKPKSPFAKLRQTVKGKSTKSSEKVPQVEKVAEPAAEKEAEPATEPAVEPAAAAADTSATSEAAVVSEPVPVATTTPQVSATA